MKYAKFIQAVGIAVLMLLIGLLVTEKPDTIIVALFLIAFALIVLTLMGRLTVLTTTRDREIKKELQYLREKLRNEKG